MKNIIFLLLLIGISACFAQVDSLENAFESNLYVIETNLGNITIDLFEENAPIAVKRFERLVAKTFYDSIYVHRVIPNFIVQLGDPNTRIDTLRSNDGKGGPGYTFKDQINAKSLGLDSLRVRDSEFTKKFPENHPVQNITVEMYLEKQGYIYTDDVVSKSHSFGMVSMANSGPNTNGSQFFIVTARDGATWLDGKHTVFGKVTSGIDVLLEIEKVETDGRKNPLKENQISVFSIHKLIDDNVIPDEVIE